MATVSTTSDPLQVAADACATAVQTDPCDSAADATPCDGTDGSRDGDLGWALSISGRAFGQWAGSSVSELPGGPRGYLVLATVARGRPPSQLALAQQLGVDKTVMTYLLDGLEAGGLIERRPDPADRRARQVLITKPGRAALQEFSDRLRAVEQRLLAPLSESEATTFRAMLDRVARAAHTPGPEPCLSDGPADSAC